MFSGGAVHWWLAVAAGLVLAAWPSPSAAWRRQVVGSGARVALDGFGDGFAAGSFGVFPSATFGVMKFVAATGEVLWSQTSSIGTVAAPLRVDASGDVYAGAEQADFAVIKLAGGTGAELWRRVIAGVPGACGDDADRARTLAVDGAGDLIAGGQLYAGSCSRDMLVVKLAGATGAELWRYEMTSGDYATATGVAVDAAGDVIVGGNDTSPFSGVVVKLAGATGAELWRYEAGPPGPGVVVAAGGDVIVAGSVVVRVAGATGAELWRHGPWDRSVVALDAAGDVLVGVTDDQPAPQRDIFMQKLSGATGALLWELRPGPATHQDPNIGDALVDVAVDSAGDAVFTGSLLYGNHGYDFFVAKVAGTSGKLLWRQEVDSGGSDGAGGVEIDAAGNLVVAGRVGGLAVFGINGLDGAIGPVAGRTLLVQDWNGQPARRRIKAVMRDSTVATAAAGTVGDPVVGGATVRLENPTSGESATFVLPAGSGWTAVGSPPGSRGYVYKDLAGAAGPCIKARVMPKNKIEVECRGQFGDIPFTLDEASQGSLRVSVRLGTSAAQCATFGGTVQADAGTSSPGPAGTFKARNAARPTSGSCP
jgi:hypothetical protein